MSESAVIRGFDFTSAPDRKKPITCAQGLLTGDLLRIDRIDRLTDFAQFEAALNEPGPWTAGFDFPFSLPRTFVEQVGWPIQWEDMVLQVATMGQPDFASTIRSYCAGKPPGSKHPRRTTDVAANSRSPLMLDYTPVGKMFFQGSWRLAKAGLCIQPCRRNADDRVAVEAYPALVARRWIARPSYKSDMKRKQTPIQAEQRSKIVDGLRGNEVNDVYGFGVAAPHHIWERCISDPSADVLDALMCCVQAAWAHPQRTNGYGVPSDIDPLEGWIVDPSIVRATNSRSARIGG